MADFCYCSTTNAGGNKRTVRLKFLRKQLLYDIENDAYIEADVMGEEKQHAQHVLADIGEDGNVDRVSRVLSTAHATVTELLYPMTRQLPVEEEIDDCLHAPEEYVVELNVEPDVSRTTLHLLSKLIHDYMVCMVLADWLSTTNPDAAATWAEKAETKKKEILGARNNHKATFTRKTHPW